MRTLNPILLVAGFSFCCCFVLTPFVRSMARRWNLVDRPDAGRKLHGRVVPVAGGIVLIVSLLGAMGLLFFLPTSAQEEIHDHQEEMVSFLAGVSVICLVGVVDDSWNLRGWIKLLGQLLAIGVVMSSGLLIRNVRFLSYCFELGPFAAPFTVVLLLGAINSLNLIYGMDG